jgi:hypothetical protein
LILLDNYTVVTEKVMRELAKLKGYYFTAVVSLLFAVIGFSYNAWRMEVSESNNNVRTASFEVLKALAELERNVFAAHYDQDSIKGNPREGWVQVGLISDLSVLIDPKVESKANALKTQWGQNWEMLPTTESSATTVVAAIDEVRVEIKDVLSSLQ